MCDYETVCNIILVLHLFYNYNETYHITNIC